MAKEKAPRGRSRAGAPLTRRAFVTLSAATIAVPGILRHTRAYARERVFKVGYSTPLTGVFSGNSKADLYVLAEIKTVLAGGIENNGRRVEVQILDRDCESIHAGETAADLVFSEKVDLLAATSTPDATNPVADLAEINGVPCITTESPWQPFFFGRGGDPEVGFSWTYHFFWGLEDLIAAFVALWEDQPGVARAVGGLFGDVPDSKGWTSPEIGFPPALEKAGFTWIQPPFYPMPFGARSPYAGKPPPTDFFHQQIAAFKDAGCEVLTANMSPNEFALFYDQATAEGFKPKIATIARALLFPADIEMLGDRADGLSTEIWWGPAFPYRSSLTGQSARQLADAYTAATGRAWVMSLGFKHALFEVIVDVIQRTADLDDPAAVADAIATTRLDTVVGPIEWSGKPVKNVAKTQVVTGQWRKQADGFELVIVNNTTAPEMPAGGSLQLLS